MRAACGLGRVCERRGSAPPRHCLTHSGSLQCLQLRCQSSTKPPQQKARITVSVFRSECLRDGVCACYYGYEGQDCSIGTFVDRFDCGYRWVWG